MVAHRLSPTLPRLPDPASVDVTKPEELVSFLSLLTASLTKHLQQRPMANQTLDQVLLRAPDGATHRIKVEDDGTVVSEPFGSANIPPGPAMIDEYRHSQLERALADAGGTHTLTDILDMITDGRMQSFAAGETWAVTYITETPRKRVLDVFLVVGDMVEATRLHDEVEAWAKAHGCTMLRTVARKGWLKWAIPRGWSNKHTVYTKDL